MNLDEFAFLNRQLAGMLQAGIPLEGALRQLCAEMQATPLRAELERLNADLAGGTPLRDALPRRQLPRLYVELMRLGAKANDLPGVLVMLADYYQQRHSLWMRLKGLLVYPALVLGAALVLSGVFQWLFHAARGAFLDAHLAQAPDAIHAIWVPVIWIAGAAALMGLAVLVPSWRDWIQWRMPGFREFHVAQFAGTMRLMLQQGVTLPEALELTGQMEGDSQLGREVARWRSRLAAGQGKLEQFAAGSALLPQMFLWLVGQSGERLAEGFERAAEVYRERARHRVEMLLYATLPVSVLVLGLLVLAQVALMVQCLIVPMLNALGSVG
jgi:type II secretory pathway component PulF